ncbi:hypothetical protein BJX66DRAFT_89527 [Aspergillus keveii]|uniref:SnoaL-like domain-containing protein n=1 Tax=Aspergillus keveii TaxID=714993 RepID=A0ABR4FM40_9EURO
MPYTLEEISSRLEITDIYARYVHAADARDFDTLDHIFLPETIFDWTSCGGGKMSYTEAKAGPVFQGKLFPWSYHIYANPQIDCLDGGERARVLVKAVNPSGLPQGGNGASGSGSGKPVMFQTHGTYTDDLVKTEAGWRIVNRYWDEAFITGPFEKVEGIPGMLGLAGVKMDG